MSEEKRVGVIVAICTYFRNDELVTLLSKLVEFGASRWNDIDLGVTVVDDSPDGHARAIVERYATSFRLGLVYENTASRNISVARNRALENSLARAPWVAMTDDDCEPSEQWLAELLRVQGLAKADVVTGLMLRRAPPNAPHWLKTQPFLQLGEFEAEDGDELSVAFTNNSLIASGFLLENPDLRFDADLGRTGGEDVAFFRTLKNRGARIAFAKTAFVYEKLPDNRMSLRYQLRRYFWHGNSSVVTSLYSGKGRGRMAVHSLATVARAFIRPVKRVLAGQSPQLIYGVAQVCEGLGKLVGTLGIRINHS